MTPRIRFDRHELAGSFGDLGTSLPLIVLLIPAAGLDPTGVLIGFGLLQILTGVVYGIPMPVQPLKAMAVIVIAERLASGVVFAAGFAIGAIVLVCAIVGLLRWLAGQVPRSTVRGLQLGLGLSLAQIAVKQYLPAHGTPGYLLAGIGFAVMILLAGRRRVPAGLVLIGLGIVYTVVFRYDRESWGDVVRLSLPRPGSFTLDDLRTALTLLVPAQFALSLGNSIIATERTVRDLFPDRPVTIRRLGITYGLMNLVSPWIGGIPVCHGCGGLAGHHALGARTGGSVILAGSYYLIAGLFFAPGFSHLLELFPTPILGVILVFEAVALIRLIADQAGDSQSFAITVLVGVIAFTLPHGYVIGLVLGTLLGRLPNRFGAAPID